MKSPRLTILAIDLGTQSLRVSAFSAEGARNWSWSEAVYSETGGAAYIQQPSQWKQLLSIAFDEAAGNCIDPDVIVATGPLAGFTPVDRNGVSIGPAVMYLDGRASTDIGRVEEAIQQSSSAQQSSFRVTLADPLPQWLRLQREEPRIATATSKLLDATGWINHHLTGAATLNSYTALRLYSDDVLERLGVDRRMFGTTVAVGQQIGPLRSDLAEAHGFRPVPVISAPFDSKCAYLAGALSETGVGLDISGTVTSLGVFQANEIVDMQKRVYSIPHNSGWLVRGSTACAGSAIEWARQNLLRKDFSTWTKDAESIEPGAEGVTFLPYLAGERAPLWNPNARGALLGLTLDTSDAVIGRAVLESLAYALCDIIDVMRECGAIVGTLRLSGGLSRNDLLSQIKADVTGLPLDHLRDFELTSLGLVAIAVVALGVEKNLDAVCARLSVIDKRFDPCPTRHQAYKQHYARYRNYREALRPTFVPEERREIV